MATSDMRINCASHDVIACDTAQDVTRCYVFNGSKHNLGNLYQACLIVTLHDHALNRLCLIHLVKLIKSLWCV